MAKKNSHVAAALGLLFAPLPIGHLYVWRPLRGFLLSAASFILLLWVDEGHTLEALTVERAIFSFLLSVYFSYDCWRIAVTENKIVGPESECPAHHSEFIGAKKDGTCLSPEQLMNLKCPRCKIGLAVPTPVCPNCQAETGFPETRFT